MSINAQFTNAKLYPVDLSALMTFESINIKSQYSIRMAAPCSSDVRTAPLQHDLILPVNQVNIKHPKPSSASSCLSHGFLSFYAILLSLYGRLCKAGREQLSCRQTEVEEEERR